MPTELPRSDPAFAGGSYAGSDDVRHGLARHAMAFAMSGTGRRFFREEMLCRLVFTSVEKFTLGFMRGCFQPMDPNHEPGVAAIRDARLRVIDSPLGHFTIFDLLHEGVPAIDEALAEVRKSGTRSRGAPGHRGHPARRAVSVSARPSAIGKMRSRVPDVNVNGSVSHQRLWRVLEDK
ncbi:hypothetical protein QRX60_51095 [Amycolatopsis mongoliensis]|uniref:Uncharacterized protein n=1 Tax=Amycolatopsis mongoliensis TaxID=715475 RepID=A0A9Y2JPD9_9PSEU|nr:hypothetical protein [Amycolatopsis sp. 4-36]WIY02240.1 hypothetical protein QRX60_51095 [Amycolatopsis sp. 4-36]